MIVSPDGCEQPELGTYVLNEGRRMTRSGLGSWSEVGLEDV